VHYSKDPRFGIGTYCHKNEVNIQYPSSEEGNRPNSQIHVNQFTMLGMYELNIIFTYD
jgi:hypothetical protein